MQGLQRTPLYSEHLRLKAQMAPFGGWEMPIQYAGILNEHKACREGAALFDICHMGEFHLKGNIEKSGIEKAVCIPVSRIFPGRCKYGPMLNDKGGIIDDLIIYRLAEDELMIVVNAETTEKDFNNIKKYLNGIAVFQNISERTAKLDLQGPLTRDILIEKFGKEIESIPYFGFKKLDILGEKAVISRTGYTGELGYEIYIDSGSVKELWDILLSDPRVKPAGLGARDILRLEVGYSLYGHDIDEETTPLEAGLEAFIDFTKDFNGKDALLRQKEKGIEKKKIAFMTNSRRSPRRDYKITADGIEIGIVTSGVFSPMLSCGIGLGYVNVEYSKTGTKLVIKQDAVEIEAVITGLPFYKNGSLRK